MVTRPTCTGTQQQIFVGYWKSDTLIHPLPDFVCSSADSADFLFGNRGASPV